MKANGMLEVAQLEEVAAATVSPTPRSRIFSDVTDASNPIPRLYDGSRYMPFRLRKEVLQSLTSNTVLTAVSERVLTDATGGAITHTLPAASTMTGECIFLQKTDTTFNIVHINRAGGDTIDGLTTTALTSYMEWILIRSTGTGWTTLEWGYDSARQAFTPTGSWIANATYTGFWWRTGDSINVEVKVAATGAPTSASLTVTLPVTLATSKFVDTTGGAVTPVASNCNILDTSAGDHYLGSVGYSSSTALAIFYPIAGTNKFAACTQAAPMTFATGDKVIFQALALPVSGWRGSISV
jgi:hypothetical protein